MQVDLITIDIHGQRNYNNSKHKSDYLILKTTVFRHADHRFIWGTE